VPIAWLEPWTSEGGRTSTVSSTSQRKPREFTTLLSISRSSRNAMRRIYPTERRKLLNSITCARWQGVLTGLGRYRNRSET
jgi:hypothetical protein